MKLPQLTLRDLFWLVLVCALAVGWWVNRWQVGAANDENLRYLARVLLESGQEWREERKSLENERKLWQYRVETLAASVQKDGYRVTWSGSWNDHTVDIQPPNSP